MSKRTLESSAAKGSKEPNLPILFVAAKVRFREMGISGPAKSAYGYVCLQANFPQSSPVSGHSLHEKDCGLSTWTQH
jgi:hypothetical protein